MNSLLQLVFKRRGYTDEFIEQIMDMQESHSELLHAKEMVDILYYHRENEITILTDFDADGILSGVTAFAGLSEMGFRVNLYTPDPKDGHEWDYQVIDKLMQQYPETKVLITCDSGTSCYDGVARAKAYGLIVLVTDHHPQIGAPTSADLVVNPSKFGETYEHKEICGCFVIYQILELYAKTYLTVITVSQIERLRLLVGVATVADVMPVYHESRGMIKDAITLAGMIQSNEFADWLWGCQPYVNVFLGFQTILRKLSGLKKLYDTDEQFFGWTLSPILNTPKRLNLPPASVFTIFLSNDQTQREEAFDYLSEINEKRKALVTKEYESMKSADQPYAPLIYYSDADSGILGLLASKAAEESGLSAFVIKRYCDGTCSGSGRAPIWLPMHKVIRDIGMNDVQIKGHDGAFGVSCPGSRVRELYDKLSSYVSEAWKALPSTERGASYDLIMGNGSDTDAMLDLDILWSFYKSIQEYKPFGKGFPEPSILLKIDASSSVTWNRIGADNKHLKGSIYGMFDILLWNQGHIEVEKMDYLEITGKLSKSTFKDVTSLTFVGNIGCEEER